MRQLPVLCRWADVVIAGWAIGHLRGWFTADWKRQIGRVLGEMHRAVASGGALIILETMTTGSLKPAPPTRELAEYYQWIEEDWGFSREVIQTDYQFSGVEEAVAYTEFFFGAELADASSSPRLGTPAGMDRRMGKGGVEDGTDSLSQVAIARKCRYSRYYG